MYRHLPPPSAFIPGGRWERPVCEHRQDLMGQMGMLERRQPNEGGVRKDPYRIVCSGRRPFSWFGSLEEGELGSVTV